MVSKQVFRFCTSVVPIVFWITRLILCSIAMPACAFDCDTNSMPMAMFFALITSIIGLFVILARVVTLVYTDEQSSSHNITTVVRVVFNLFNIAIDIWLCVELGSTCSAILYKMALGIIITDAIGYVLEPIIFCIEQCAFARRSKKRTYA